MIRTSFTTPFFAVAIELRAWCPRAIACSLTAAAVSALLSIASDARCDTELDACLVRSAMALGEVAIALATLDVCFVIDPDFRLLSPSPMA